MKKIYLLSSAILLSVASYAQSGALGHAVTLGVKPSFNKTAGAGERITFPDTTGIGVGIISDFSPQFNPNNTPNLIFGYTGGGYVYGNNNAGSVLPMCAQGYLNLNSAAVKITDVMLFFVAKKSSSGSSATSKVVVKLYDMAANRACNQASGAANTTTLNFEGPVATIKAQADLLFSAIDTTSAVGFNVVNFPTGPNFAGDFAVGVDFSTLVAGDTAGLLCDAVGSAFNADLAYHYVAGSINKWCCTDDIFSGSTGSGGTDNDIAIFAILANATGINEYFNGMKLTTYPNPAVENTTIEYTLEKNSSNVSLVIFDATGRKIVNNSYNEQTAGTYKVDLETANLKPGTYYYQLNANGHNFTKKLVITK